jgi:hypothetical protein
VCKNIQAEAYTISLISASFLSCFLSRLSQVTRGYFTERIRFCARGVTRCPLANLAILRVHLAVDPPVTTMRFSIEDHYHLPLLLMLLLPRCIPLDFQITTCILPSWADYHFPYFGHLQVLVKLELQSMQQLRQSA